MCVICGKNGTEFETLYEKGATSINRAILVRKHNLKNVHFGQVVHSSSRKDYCS